VLHAPATTGRSVSFVVSGAVTLVLAVVFAVWAYDRWSAHRVLVDDAFISFRYADNLVRGNGLVYNVGEKVEGYTNFLWVLLAALALKLGRDPIAVTQSVGVGCYLAVVFGGVWLTASPSLGPTLRRLPAAALVCLLVTPSGFASFSGTGLETSFLGLVVPSMGVFGLLLRESRVSHAVALVLPLVALLTRLDTGLAVAAYAVVLIASPVLRPRRHWLAECAVRLGPAAVGFGAYTVWKLAYYGELLPNSYYAKAAYVTRFDAGLAYVGRFTQSYPGSLLLVSLAVFGLCVTRDARRRAFLQYALLALGLQVAYVAKVGGDFMEYRLLWEYWPLLVWAAVLGAMELAEKTFPVAVAASALALAATSGPTVLESDNYMQSLDEMNGYANVAQMIGPALERSLPSGTLVSTTLAGTAYFMPDIVVLDQWGLNDKFVGHLHVNDVHGRGHIKAAPVPYLKRRGVNLYLEHPTICDCDHLCRESKPDVFVRLGVRNQCLRAWYLTQTPTLTRLFCSTPGLFVLDNIDCHAPD
jgi:hypothetical protein